MSRVSVNGRCVRLLMVLVMTGSALWAQAERGAITGAVTDAIGGVILAAEITVTNVDINASYSTTSTGSGTYRVPNLPPGTHNVTCNQGRIQASLDREGSCGGERNRERGCGAGGWCRYTQAATVEAHAEQLQTRAEINTDVSPKEFETWPVIIDTDQRQPSSFVFNSLPGTTGGTFTGAVNGGQTFGFEVQMSIG